MEDYILRATANNNSIRIFVAYTKNIVNTAQKKHNTSNVVSAALGRTLTMGALMSSTLKNTKDLLTLNIKGNGPIGNITVTADSDSNVKGYVDNPDVNIDLKPNGKLDVKSAVGNGILTVIKDIGLKQPYIGKINLISSEIAEDFTYYFASSEQTPSAVSLGVLVNKDKTIAHAGGFMIQLMPKCTEETISTIEKNLKNLPSITKLYSQNKTPEDILNMLCENIEYKILEKRTTSFKCNCSKEKMEKALISIGKKDLEDIIKTDKQAEIHCHFCNCSYTFNENELLNILNKINKEV